VAAAVVGTCLSLVLLLILLPQIPHPFPSSFTAALTTSPAVVPRIARVALACADGGIALTMAEASVGAQFLLAHALERR